MDSLEVNLHSHATAASTMEKVDDSRNVFESKLCEGEVQQHVQSFLHSSCSSQ